MPSGLNKGSMEQVEQIYCYVHVGLIFSMPTKT